MQQMINLLANIAANAENVDACVVAAVMKPTEENPDPVVEVLTVGDSAISMFGISEFIKMEIYKQLGRRS